MAKKVYKFSDQVVGQIRELLTMCIITQQSVVDHCRAVRLEESESNPGVLILSEDYVKGWNEMGEMLQKQAEEKARAQATTLADDADDGPEEEVVISRDPTTGKLVGKLEKARAN